MAEMRARQAMAEAQKCTAHLPALPAEARRADGSVAHGSHGRRRAGAGDDFWQFRPRSDGDGYHDIDWRQSARTSQFYVRDKEWEIARTTWFWCDVSPSMQWSGDARSRPDKAWAALVITLALSDLLLRGGERVGVLGAGARPVTGRHGLERMAAALDQVSPEHAHSVPPPENRLSRHARMVLVSDFLEDIDTLEQHLSRFAAMGVAGRGAGGGTGHLVQVLDPFEESLPFTGRTEFEGLEGEGRVEFGKAQSVAGDYRNALQTHRDRLRALSRRMGWSLTVHHTDKPPPLLSLFQTLSQVGTWMGGGG